MKGDSFKHKQDSSSNIHCRDLECKLFNGGIKYGHSFGSYRRVGFVSEGVRAQNQFQFPVFDVSSCSKLYASEVSDHGSSLYENEVRIDKQTLKVKATYYPAKIAKPLKSNGLHKSADEDPKAFVPAISTSRKSQAHGKYYIHKECPIAKEKKPTFSSILYSHNEDYSRRDMSIRHKESQCSSILHSSYDTGIESAVPVFKAKVHEQTLRQSTASQNDRKYTEKADAFAPHAPLQPAEFKHEGSKPDQSIPLGSKGQKDWRSKSMGAKATIKSAVKNLEATLSGHRSLSLPKTRPQPIKQSKHESSKLLDRVFISPIRARSKQVSTMKTAERLDKHIEESKDGKVAERKEAKATNSKLLPHSVGPTVRPFSPIGQSNREVSCKPFIASRINTYLSAEIGVHRAVNTFNSDWNEDACSADASYKCGMLDAQLRYTERDGQLYYTMAIIGSEDLMLAKPCWVESHSNGGTSMCQYLFYSGQVRSRGGANGWRSWIRKENKPSLDICGIMKVSNINENAVHLARNALEFVLYDGRSAVEVPHSQSLRFCSADKPNTLSRDYSVASSISSSTLQMSSACSVSSSPIHLDVTANKHCKVSRTDLFPVDKGASMRNDSIQRSTPGHKPSLSFDSWSELDLLESAPLPVFMPCSSSEFELAAIIIQVSAEGNNCSVHDRHINQKGLDSGVKHLIDEFSHIATPRMESSSLDQANSNPKEAPVDEKLNLSGRYDHKQIQNENQTPNQVKMMQHYQNSSLRENMISQESPARITLLLPMGAHSSPLSDSRGPSSLLDRYRSGGACDCGGWDLGCGIDVISSEDTIENGSPYKQRDGVIHNEEKINLFSQVLALVLSFCKDLQCILVTILCRSFRSPMSY
ncbi:hypothetical protein KP509_35G027700 [Ceratopteris richardii]|nr:hypothetical protein KP509_35G027700 [Ceratopteris richardii]